MLSEKADGKMAKAGLIPVPAEIFMKQKKKTPKPNKQINRIDW